MSAIKVRRLEFHITNACNLNCHGCDAMSNYNLSAHHELWQEHADDYARWAQVLDIGQIGFQGGEPLANPDYRNWIRGLRGLWPRAEIWMATNGTLLHKKAHADLYQLCLEYDIGLIVSLHNKNTYEQDMASLTAWLQAPVNEASFIENHDAPAQIKYLIEGYRRIKDPSWPDCASYQDWMSLPEHIRQECTDQHGFVWLDVDKTKQALLDNKNIKTLLVDQNQIKVQVKQEWSFQNPPVHVSGNTFMFCDSNIEQAHAVCNQSMCHQFYRGELYKCSAMHVFKEIVQEFDHNLAPGDLELLNRYQPAQSHWSRERIQSFLQDLHKPMAQCKLCPEQVTQHEVNAELGKKVHLLKKI